MTRCADIEISIAMMNCIERKGQKSEIMRVGNLCHSVTYNTFQPHYAVWLFYVHGQ